MTTPMDEERKAVSRRWKDERERHPGMAKRTFATNRLFGAIPNGLVDWLMGQEDLRNETLETSYRSNFSRHLGLCADIYVSVLIRPEAPAAHDSPWSIRRQVNPSVSLVAAERRAHVLEGGIRSALNLLDPGPCSHGVACEGCRADWARASELLHDLVDAED